MLFVILTALVHRLADKILDLFSEHFHEDLLANTLRFDGFFERNLDGIN